MKTHLQELIMRKVMIMNEVINKPIEQKILNAIQAVGIIIEGFPENDIDLAMLLEDSIHFVTLIVTIEEELQIVIPDDFLLIDNFHSLNGFISMLEEVVKLGDAVVL